MMCRGTNLRGAQILECGECCHGPNNMRQFSACGSVRKASNFIYECSSVSAEHTSTRRPSSCWVVSLMRHHHVAQSQTLRLTSLVAQAIVVQQRPQTIQGHNIGRPKLRRSCVSIILPKESVRQRRARAIDLPAHFRRQFIWDDTLLFQKYGVRAVSLTIMHGIWHPTVEH